MDGILCLLFFKLTYWGKGLCSQKHRKGLSLWTNLSLTSSQRMIKYTTHCTNVGERRTCLWSWHVRVSFVAVCVCEPSWHAARIIFFVTDCEVRLRGTSGDFTEGVYYIFVIWCCWGIMLMWEYLLDSVYFIRWKLARAILSTSYFYWHAPTSTRRPMD